MTFPTPIVSRCKDMGGNACLDYIFIKETKDTKEPGRKINNLKGNLGFNSFEIKSCFLFGNEHSENDFGLYPSDHYGIQCELHFK